MFVIRLVVCLVDGSDFLHYLLNFVEDVFFLLLLEGAHLVKREVMGGRGCWWWWPFVVRVEVGRQIGGVVFAFNLHPYHQLL